VWGENFEFKSSNAALEYIRFYVFDHDNIGKDDLLGWAEISLADVKAAGGYVDKT